MEPRYPDITVQLTGQDGNAFAILGRCQQAMRQADVPKDEIDEFWAEARLAIAITTTCCRRA